MQDRYTCCVHLVPGETIQTEWKIGLSWYFLLAFIVPNCKSIFELLTQKYINLIRMLSCVHSKVSDSAPGACGVCGDCGVTVNSVFTSYTGYHITKHSPLSSWLSWEISRDKVHHAPSVTLTLFTSVTRLPPTNRNMAEMVESLICRATAEELVT